MICNECKILLDDDSIFCSKCGKEIFKEQLYDLQIADNTEITIGRANNNDLIIDNKFVSKNHAKIIYKQNDFLIEDLNSKNGVYVNGIKISKSIVSSSDKITITKNIVLDWEDILSTFRNKNSLKRSDNLSKNEIKIGRHSNNDVIIDNIKVSRHHAKLYKEGESWFLEDLGSTNGTYVNGNKIKKTAITDKDSILIGGIPLKLKDILEKKKNIKGDVSITLENVSFEIKGKKIIDGISLTILPGEFVGLIGPSGSGKTTLMMLINGIIVPTKGKVLINDQNLHDNFSAFKGQIGYVPQDDIIHRELTVKESLLFTAKLRLETILTEDVETQVNKVLNTLKLKEVQDILIGTAEKKGISGGQRKRVNLAQELITEPSLLFLDEPTSGLDPRSDKDVMKHLKNISEKGKIVLLTTHAITEENFSILTHLIVLTKQGKLAYFGPSNSACEYFGVNKPSEIFDKLESQEPEKWKAKYLQSKYYKEFVIKRKTEIKQSNVKKLTKKTHPNFSQLLVLIRRYFKIKIRDRLSTLILLLQAPIISFFIAFVFNRNEEKVQALFIMVIAAIWLGCSNAVREIVSEQAIYKRERMINLSILYYLLSKIIILAMLCFVQNLILVSVITNFLEFEGNVTLLFLILLLTSIASVSIGLLISSLVKTNESAMGLVPILLIPMIILGGLISKFASMKDFIKVISSLMISRWSFEASLIAEFEYNGLNIIKDIGFSTKNLLLDILVIAAFNFIFFFISYYSLKKKDKLGE